MRLLVFDLDGTLTATGDVEMQTSAADPESEPRALCRDSRCRIAGGNLHALIEFMR